MTTRVHSRPGLARSRFEWKAIDPALPRPAWVLKVQMILVNHGAFVTEIKDTICLITNVQEYTLLVFKDCHGYQVDAIAPNGDRYCKGEIFYSALRAEAKGREWIEDLRDENEE